jgi:hypothetical protein
MFVSLELVQELVSHPTYVSNATAELEKCGYELDELSSESRRVVQLVNRKLLGTLMHTLLTTSPNAFTSRKSDRLRLYLPMQQQHATENC